MADQMYINDNLRVTSGNEIMDLINSTTDHNSEIRALIAIDYYYHREDNNYDGGLSMLDRLAYKLRCFDHNWDVQNLKERIRSANSPQDEFVNVLTDILASEMIGYYGF